MAYRRKQTGPAFSTSARAIVMEAREAEAQVPKGFIDEFQKWLKQGQSLQGQARAWAQTESMRQGEETRISALREEKQLLSDQLADADTRLSLIRSALGKLNDGSLSLFQFAQEADQVLKA